MSNNRVLLETKHLPYVYEDRALHTLICFHTSRGFIQVKIKIYNGCYVSTVCPTFKIGLSRRNAAKVRRDKMI